MSQKIEPRNKMAQVLHRAAGNPANTLPTSAISNCFPGLEYDFKNFWRRSFVGIVLLEWDNYVLEAEDLQYQKIVGHRLLKIDGHHVVTDLKGPQIPGGDPVTLTSDDLAPNFITMEWSNSLARVLQNQGKEVLCHFTADKAALQVGIPDDPAKMIEVRLKVRTILDGGTASPADGLLQPGELTQSLCSPWQHDYRECACYYWPASRPDYVNVEPSPDGISHGDNWLARERTGHYVLDDRKDSRMVSYNDLFTEWEKHVHFVIQGRDSKDS
jgi:hypothetical protein